MGLSRLSIRRPGAPTLYAHTTHPARYAYARTMRTRALCVHAHYAYARTTRMPALRVRPHYAYARTTRTRALRVRAPTTRTHALRVHAHYAYARALRIRTPRVRALCRDSAAQTSELHASTYDIHGASSRDTHAHFALRIRTARFSNGRCVLGTTRAATRRVHWAERTPCKPAPKRSYHVGCTHVMLWGGRTVSNRLVIY